MSEKDLADCMVISARTMVEKEPNYSYVTARILLNNIENVQTFNYGIAEKKGYEFFDDNLINYKNSGSFRFTNQNTNNSDKVKIYSLDELVED